MFAYEIHRESARDAAVEARHAQRVVKRDPAKWSNERSNEILQSGQTSRQTRSWSNPVLNLNENGLVTGLPTLFKSS